MLTQREMFKVSFLQQCAQLGLTMDETEEMAKEAIARLSDTEKTAFGFGSIMSGGGSLLRGAGSLLATGAGLAGLGAVGAGAGVGYVLGRGKGISDEDVKEEKSRELVEAYQRAAERARSKSNIRRRKRMKPNIIRSLV